MEQLIFRRFAVFCLLSIKIGENVGVHDGHSREFSGKWKKLSALRQQQKKKRL